MPPKRQRLNGGCPPVDARAVGLQAGHPRDQGPPSLPPLDVTSIILIMIIKIVITSIITITITMYYSLVIIIIIIVIIIISHSY